MINLTLLVARDRSTDDFARISPQRLAELGMPEEGGVGLIAGHFIVKLVASSTVGDNRIIVPRDAGFTANETVTVGETDQQSPSLTGTMEMVGPSAAGERSAVHGFLSEPSLDDPGFDEVVGFDTAKVLVKKFLDFARGGHDRDGVLKYRLQSPKGIMLCGIPGSGKTFFARAVRKEASNIAKFFLVDPSDIKSKWYGESGYS